MTIIREKRATSYLQKEKKKKKKKIVLKEYKNLKRERMKEKDKLRWFGL
jgi:hypothetical protein